MANVVVAPTPESEECCVCLDSLLRAFVATSGSMTLSSAFESDHEARRSMFLVARYTESVVELARIDLAYYPSAMVLGRSALETAMRIVWIMTSEDPLDREARWMAKLDEYRVAIRRIKTRLATTGQDVTWLQERLNYVEAAYTDALQKFSPGFEPPSTPNMAELLIAEKVEADYAHYVLGSQFTHGGLMATEIYRDALVGSNEPVERTIPGMWVFPFQYCWVGLQAGWERFLERTGGDVQSFASPELERRMVRAIQKLQGSSH